MIEYNEGDLIKVTLPDSAMDSVHKFLWITDGDSFTPEGWIATDGGTFNPDHCIKYNGAISCLEINGGV